jgi:hypothetical protein
MPADTGVGQRLLHLAECGGAVVGLDDDLGQHRVVERRHFAAAFDPGFNPSLW